MSKLLLFYRIFLLLFCLNLAWADRLEAVDGSVLNGEFVKLDRGTVYFKTKFAGIIQVPLSEILDLKVEKPQYLKFTDNGTKLRYVEFRDKEFLLKGVEGLVIESVIANDIAVAWPEGTKAPGTLESEESKWKKKVHGGFAKKSGNVNESSLNLGFDFAFKNQDNRMQFYGSYYETSREDKISRSEKKLGYDYENQFSPKNQWYIRQELEKDTVERLTLRSELATGLGYYIIDKKQVNLRFRLGVLHSFEDFEEKEDRSEPGADTGLNYKHTFVEGVEFNSELSYLPSFGEETVYRAIHHSYLTLPWSFNINWKFKLGIKHEYDSDPTTDNEPLDTRYYTNLELNF